MRHKDRKEEKRNDKKTRKEKKQAEKDRKGPPAPTLLVREHSALSIKFVFANKLNCWD